ncbi:hypothetical protein PHISCL_00462 [Aspergillus sclerotialis]|uniref:HbrB n=1 Tax=Aspergillus sclerotialis TaxID=2070753 RepID=A0A3A3AD42_9EURO|nr:hypothetical protein PHISCL_00462 [Aspergillus sclerotialis]
MNPLPPPPPPPRSPDRSRHPHPSQPFQSRPSLDDDDDDSGSDASSVTSNVTTVTALQPNNQGGTAAGSATIRPPRTSSIAAPSNTSTAPPISRRPSAPLMSQNELSVRKVSGRGAPSDAHKHRFRHHSQGFFEPSLPTASPEPNMSTSRIAAQAAMQHQQSSSQYMPKRPQMVSRTSEDAARSRRDSSDSIPPPPPPKIETSNMGPSSQQPSPNGTPGHTNVATTAANVVFPRNAGLAVTTDQPPEREHKPKSEKSKMKLFSKPKHIGISRDKDPMKDRGMPSPSKMGFPGTSGLSRMVSMSATSLVDNHPAHQSMYNLPNGSTNTVQPSEKQPGEKEKDKDKVHKHHFLSRQKLKLKDNDHYNLPLSSAWSNSKPSDPSAPQSLYSFTPASPGTVSTTFGKSVSGLDILHGGRALREKKKEEKALAESEQHDGPVNGGTPAVFPGPSSLGSSTGVIGETALRETLQGFGLNNMSPEDAWDFLKAKLLVIFDGEDVRIAIEDLNKLVLIHIQRCVQKRAPTAIIADLRELLETGFASLNHSLNGVPDEKLVPHLVQMWMLVFGTILPFIQAVFLPLDLEFKGCGSVMNLREANEFWGNTLNGTMDSGTGSGLDVRNLVLIAFRDMVILFRYEGLKATFSQLSLDSINLGTPTPSTTTKSSSNTGRPGTAASLDPGFGSYGSQSSALPPHTTGSYSSDSLSCNRSRATSNTSSNPDQLIFQSFSSPPQRPTIIHRGAQTDTSQVITETVGRMLQCVSVLASVQTGDEAQEKVETLSKALKHNWLGRGRTGRDRRGFVGAKIRPTMVSRTASDDSTNRTRYGDSLDWAGSSSTIRNGSSELSVL